MSEQKKKDKTYWSLDLSIDLNNCQSDKFNDNGLSSYARKITELIGEEDEILGVISPFGDHSEDMKGFKLIHENQNSLVIGRFVFKTKKAYINIMSCKGFRPSEAIELSKDFFNAESYSCQKILRE